MVAFEGLPRMAFSPILRQTWDITIENAFQNGFRRVFAVFRSVCGGTVVRPSETPWNTFQGHERTRRERERTFRHAVTTSRVPTMNQSDRTMPSAVCERTAPIGMDAPCSLSGLGEKCVRICESQPSWTKLLIDGWRVDMNGLRSIEPVGRVRPCCLMSLRLQFEPLTWTIRP